MTGRSTPDWRAALPWPGQDAHKHARGRLGVVSGKANQTGAARLAARAGLRIGAGVVRILCPPDATAVIASAVEAVMVTPFGSDDALAEAAEGMDAVVIGPAAGVTDATQAHVRALAGTGAALVVDADGLTVFEGWPTDLFDVLDRDDVLTPHEGEFKRLFPGLLDKGREAAAQAAAKRAGAVVVLKGPATIIAAPDGRLAINDNGVPWLATAGTGDVLAGMIGARLAAGQTALQAACDAVYLHGLLAEQWPAGQPLTAGELAKCYTSHSTNINKHAG